MSLSAFPVNDAISRKQEHIFLGPAGRPLGSVPVFRKNSEQLLMARWATRGDENVEAAPGRVKAAGSRFDFYFPSSSQYEQWLVLTGQEREKQPSLCKRRLLVISLMACYFRGCILHIADDAYGCGKSRGHGGRRTARDVANEFHVAIHKQNIRAARHMVKARRHN